MFPWWMCNRTSCLHMKVFQRFGLWTRQWKPFDLLHWLHAPVKPTLSRGRRFLSMLYITCDSRKSNAAHYRRLKIFCRHTTRVKHQVIFVQGAKTYKFQTLWEAFANYTRGVHSNVSPHLCLWSHANVSQKAQSGRVSNSMALRVSALIGALWV